jgi:integrase
VTKLPGSSDDAAAAVPRSTTKNRAKTRGLGGIYRRGEIWWVQYHFQGKLYRESSKSTVQARATDLLRSRHAEMGRGRLLGPTMEKTTFENLAQMLIVDYEINGRKSLDRAKRSVVHLRKFFGLSRAIDITPDRVSAYISSRMAAAKPATIRNELAALKRMFTLGVRAGKVSHRPLMPSIEVRNTRSGFFEEAELRAVLRELPADLRVMIEFVHLSGWRIGEVKQLTWRQVDFGSCTVRLEPGTTKNDEARTLPFGGWARLKHLMVSQREHTSALEREQGRLIPWVFHRNGKPILSFHDAWRRACERARVPDRLVHDLRRTAVRNFERAGVARSVAMKLSGHKTESIYTRYAIVSEADLAEAIRKVAGLSGDDESAADRVAHVSRAKNS